MYFLFGSEYEGDSWLNSSLVVEKCEIKNEKNWVSIIGVINGKERIHLARNENIMDVKLLPDRTRPHQTAEYFERVSSDVSCLSTWIRSAELGHSRVSYFRPIAEMLRCKRSGMITWVLHRSILFGETDPRLHPMMPSAEGTEFFK